MTSPIVLVPGWWLGAWAWDGVAALLRADGHDVSAVTLPGLESADADRASVTMEDHVGAIVGAVRAAGEGVVLAVHSGAGAPGYAASDRVPELIAAMVYVDTGPAKGVLDAEGPEVELPMPPFDELRKSENLDGISDEQLRVWGERAVPEPAAAYREAAELTNDARLDIPSTVVCTAMTSDEVKGWIEGGYPFIAGLGELRTVDYVDLPTSHWPMFSEPQALARILGEIAARRNRTELPPRITPV